MALKSDTQMEERHPYFIFGCGSVACLGAVIKLAGEAFDLHTHSLTHWVRRCSRGAGRRQMQRFSSITSMLCHQCVRPPFTFDCCAWKGAAVVGRSVQLLPQRERDIVAHMHSNEIERGESGPGSHYPRIYTLSLLPVMICSIVPMSGNDAGRPPPRSHPRAGSMANLRISRR